MQSKHLYTSGYDSYSDVFGIKSPGKPFFCHLQKDLPENFICVLSLVPIGNNRCTEQSLSFFPMQL